MVCPPLTPSRLVDGWMQRHLDRTSFALHMVGIPPTILGVLLIPVWLFHLSVPIFLFALSMFVGGYLVQFLGHALDGSEPGEIMLIRRKLGWGSGRIAAAKPPGEAA